MAYAAGRIGASGTFLGQHGVKPYSRAWMLSQGRTPVYLLTPAGLR